MVQNYPIKIIILTYIVIDLYKKHLIPSRFSIYFLSKNGCVCVEPKYI
jgi:hypothetical protein